MTVEWREMSHTELVKTWGLKVSVAVKLPRNWWEILKPMTGIPRCPLHFVYHHCCCCFNTQAYVY